MKKYAISIVADHGYRNELQVVLNSVAKYTDLTDIDVYVFTDEITVDDINTPFKPILMNIDVSVVDPLPSIRECCYRYKRYTSMKVLALDYLQDYELVMMLDADTMVRGELHSMFTNFDRNYHLETSQYVNYSFPKFPVMILSCFCILNMEHYRYNHSDRYCDVWLEHRNKGHISYSEYYLSRVTPMNRIRQIPNGKYFQDMHGYVFDEEYHHPDLMVRTHGRHAYHNARTATVLHCGGLRVYNHSKSLIPFDLYYDEVMDVADCVDDDFVVMTKFNLTQTVYPDDIPDEGDNLTDFSEYHPT